MAQLSNALESPDGDLIVVGEKTALVGFIVVGIEIRLWNKISQLWSLFDCSKPEKLQQIYEIEENPTTTQWTSEEKKGKDFFTCTTRNNSFLTNTTGNNSSTFRLPFQRRRKSLDAF